MSGAQNLEKLLLFANLKPNLLYYIDGKSLSISTKTFETADIDKINDLLEKSADAIDYTFFDENIHRFVLANQHRLSRSGR